MESYFSLQNIARDVAPFILSINNTMVISKKASKI